MNKADDVSAGLNQITADAYAGVNTSERSIERGFPCADYPNQRQYCDRHRTVVLGRWPLVTSWQPCGNYHHSVEDYRWWARMMAACLRRSWSELPPDATLRVTAFGLDEMGITRVEQRFLGRLRRRAVSYAWFREWSLRAKGRHLHLAIRGKVEAGELWRDSLGDTGSGTTYAAPVRNMIGLARYLTGDCDKPIVLPPPEVRFIFGADRGFLVRPLAALKAEVRAEWRAKCPSMRENTVIEAQPKRDPGQLLLNAREAAELVGKSVRTWRSWDAGGLVPRPIQIGRSVFWRRDELRAWIAADCPPRAKWDVLRQN